MTEFESQLLATMEKSYLVLFKGQRVLLWCAILNLSLLLVVLSRLA